MTYYSQFYESRLGESLWMNVKLLPKVYILFKHFNCRNEYPLHIFDDFKV